MAQVKRRGIEEYEGRTDRLSDDVVLLLALAAAEQGPATATRARVRVVALPRLDVGRLVVSRRRRGGKGGTVAVVREGGRCERLGGGRLGRRGRGVDGREDVDITALPIVTESAD